jgi:hypothetical protein
MVLLGGLAGLIGFFLPLLVGEGHGTTDSLSAFQAVRLGSKLNEATEQATAGSTAAEAQSARDEMGDVVAKIKAVFYALYAPALLLFLFGLIGLLKKKFGRGLGVLSFLLGLVSIGLWALLFKAIGDAGGGHPDVKLSMGIGGHLLLAAGVLGFLGGIINTVKPDHGFM